MGSGQSSVQVSDDGFQLLADSLSGVVTSNNTNTAGSTQEQQQQIRLLLSNYYRVQNGLYPGSGKMMRTYRIIEHRSSSSSSNNSIPANRALPMENGTTLQQQKQELSQSAAVVKTGWILCKSDADSTRFSEQKQDSSIVASLNEHTIELQRIYNICKNTNQGHIVPFVKWFVGNEMKLPLPISRNIIVSGPAPPVALGIIQNPQANSSQQNISNQQQYQQQQQYVVRPVYLVRPYLYTTLADRLASRPFLQKTEKLFITYQLLHAMMQFHQAGLVHGFITTENIGITSTGWVVLMDIASYKCSSFLLPDNDPSEYLYYFQPQQQSYQHDFQFLQQQQNSNQQQQSNTTSAALSGVSQQQSTSSAPSSGNVTTKTSSTLEKRCYLAPERFYTPSATSSSSSQNTNVSSGDSTLPSTNDKDPTRGGFRITQAMDIFSLGCVITELFLNGERCFDLGELLYYRKNLVLPNTVQQKLNKIESSTIRAACKHMLSIDPNQRLSAGQYCERLVAANQFAPTFSYLSSIIERITVIQPKYSNDNTTSIEEEITPNILDENSESINVDIANQNLLDRNYNRNVPQTCPDARIAVAASVYGTVMWECMGIRDVTGENYFAKVIGSCNEVGRNANVPTNDENKQEVSEIEQEKAASSQGNNAFSLSNGGMPSTDDLMSQVEAMLRDIESLNLDTETATTAGSNYHRNDASGKAISEEEKKDAAENVELNIERSTSSKSSLLIYLQILLSTVRHVQRPSTKIIALQLIDRVAFQCSNDEARLQRIVPVTITLLEDQDPLVRAYALRVLTNTVSIIQSFPPSDSKLFPQYIFKRVANMISDPSLIVRIAFTRCMASLAEIAHRFLDITHAVRLYEAVGNGTNVNSKSSTTAGLATASRDEQVFDDNVHKLLDPHSRSTSQISSSTDHSETITATDTIETETANKTLIISSSYSTELSALHEIVLRWFVHISTDQSEHSSLLKRTLLQDLGKLCNFFGLDGVMSFVLPHILAFLNERKDWQLRASLFEHLPSVCNMIGRAASEEYVLPCVEIGLVDSEERVIYFALSCLSKMVEMGMLSRSAILGVDSSLVYGTAMGRPFLRKYGILLLFPAEDIRLKAIEAYVVICKAIGTPDCEVMVLPQLRPFFRFPPQARCLRSIDAMQKFLHSPWSRKKYHSLLTSMIQIDRREPSIPGLWTTIGVSISEENDQAIETIQQEKEDVSRSDELPKNEPQTEFFQEYIQMLVKHNTQTQSSNSDKTLDRLANGIEGPVKSAQSIMFPKQNGKLKKSSLPEWYGLLRDKAQSESVVSEATSIQSISSLGHIYGLSIMGPVEGTTENIVDASDGGQGPGESDTMALHSPEAMKIEAAFRGEWGAETLLDPDVVDTCLLIPKLKALGVPPLPPQLGELGVVPLKRLPPVAKDAPFSNDSRPRIKGLLATSTQNSGHTAPVVRLAMSKDLFFFVSGSHDGTCRVWEIPQIDDSIGVLESTITYSEHMKSHPTRINDVAMLEGSHSIASAASDGSIHVWRVDMVRTETSTAQTEQRLRRDRSRVVGSSSIRQVENSEGEIIAVSHFNSPAASIITFASQKGTVHSWDLRSAREPFTLGHSPDLGYLSSMALGNDLFWMVTGTSKGYLTLWDIRFQQPVKLWQHSRRSPISRLATSCVVPPQQWSLSNAGTSGPKPYIFVASGSNECAMFDATSGNCSECFRTISLNEGRNTAVSTEEPPQLLDIQIHAKPKERNTVKPAVQQYSPFHASPLASINCMVGSIGANTNSYMVTGGSDSAIRFWDFWRPSSCYVLCGPRSNANSKPSIERIDFDSKRRLMLCKESGSPRLHENLHKIVSTPLSNGRKPEEHSHSDSIQDLKIIDNNTIVSCSRDCTVKVWR